MSSQNQKPTLGGQKIKTRKRHVKAKYDPESFRDDILTIYLESEGDLDKALKGLESSSLEYNRYGEVFFDLTIAGGIITPGGAIQKADEEPSLNPYCIFKCDEEKEVKEYVTLCNHLLRRKPFLRPVAEEAFKKCAQYLGTFSEKEMGLLASFIGQFLAVQSVPATCLNRLTEIKTAVESGLNLRFTTLMLKAFLSEAGTDKLSSSLKSAKVNLIDIFPSEIRNPTAFYEHFKKEGMTEFADSFRQRMVEQTMAELEAQVCELMVSEDISKEEISQLIEKQKADHKLSDAEVICLVWDSVVGTIEYARKSSQVISSAVSHIKGYTKLMLQFCAKESTERLLMTMVQAWCYEDPRLQDAFLNVCKLMYDEDVLSEETIKWWYTTPTPNTQKGRSEFSKQLEPFIKWLDEAEEEDSDED
eukprot:GFYU01003522.1.p1 GENE.GFYU01003522.1~~GFYU01003522.1.p1  ORF type:complete len:417 (-),score=130.85 GFYU01003522.1:358-1608(-)